MISHGLRLFILLALASLTGVARAQEATNPFARIGHFVVIYTENRSFDHVFGLFPGAEGLAGAKTPQVDHDGSPLAKLPAPKGDSHLPAFLPNAPFLLDDYFGEDAHSADPTHDFYAEQEQIDGGRMDRFVEATNVGALIMGYFDGRKLRQWKLAGEFTLADHFFHAAYGSSFLNHFYLVCACAPVFPDAPAKLRIARDPETGWLARAAASPASVLDGPPRWAQKGPVTPEGFAVATLQPKIPVSPLENPGDGHRLPLQTFATIGDRLDARGIDWAWYAGGWRAARDGKTKPATEGFKIGRAHV
jgi:acid phosphatase